MGGQDCIQSRQDNIIAVWFKRKRDRSSEEDSPEDAGPYGVCVIVRRDVLSQ